jgi:glycosyltransferase involved in cell wall biosynthesis
VTPPGPASREDDPLHAAWLVVAAYNEGPQVGDVVKHARAVFANIVVVDDGSGDATGEAAWQSGASVVTHPLNLGQGAALRTGMDYALARGARFVATLDADGQHRADDAAAMIRRLAESGADVALGSRFLGSAENMPYARRLLLRAATVFTRLTTGLDVTDAHNGLRAFTADAARRIRIRQNRMAHASEILEEISRGQLTYIEVPMVVTYTEYSLAKGQSGFGAFSVLLDLLLARLRK